MTNLGSKDAIDKAEKQSTEKWSQVANRDPLSELVLVAPIFAIYHFGILFLNIRNGADLVSSTIGSLAQHNTLLYLALTVGLAGALGFYGMRHRGEESIKASDFVRVSIEGTVLALLMLVSVGWLSAKLTAIPMLFTFGSDSFFAKIVTSCGAGFHEELVFRALLMGGLLWGGKAVFKSDVKRVVFAVVVSSVIFSAVHYIGSLGDEFTMSSFVFRFLAGVYLAAVYKFRGFASAVYTHTIYDVLVMVVIQ